LIMGGAEQLNRVKVDARAVVTPFAVLSIWNVAMLTGWTIVSPSQYVRIQIDNYDTFGRSLESYGRCQSSNPWFWLFLSLIMVADMTLIVFAAVKCYNIRNRSAYFAETQALGWSMACMMETLILGAPILLALYDQPSAFYVASTALLSALCATLLAPMFLFRVIKRHSRYADARADEKRMKDSSVSRSATRDVLALPQSRGVQRVTARPLASSSMQSSETHSETRRAMPLSSVREEPGILQEE
jgi:7 transmembrane sweet-taste receptor of 3 GCPR